ncbi:MAG TPA: amidohydrolase family protein [Solirubrobacterales bacterium]
MEGQERIIDFHCHVASGMCFPPSFLNGMVANMATALEARGVPSARDSVARFLDRTLRDPLCDELIAEMDQAGITEAVLLLPDFTYALRDGDRSIEELVEHHRAVRDRHPGRFRVFLGVDPRWGDDGVSLFERAIEEHGFDGLKLYPPCGYRLDDESLWPFYEICAREGLPVLTHIGATAPVFEFSPAHPIYVDKAAMAFPQVDFVLAHGSVQYAEECAMLCSNRPNVYLDVSGYQRSAPTSLHRLFGHRIGHKILFGTDWPIFRLQGKQIDFVEQLLAPGALPDSVSAGERRMFLAGNAERLLAKKKHERAPAAFAGGARKERGNHD